jgi:hypothetical protein
MAATVLNGTGNTTWTNNTGGNARVIINYFGSSNVSDSTKGYGISLSIGTMAVTAPLASAIGKNLSLSSGGASSTYTSAYANSINMVVLNDIISETTQQAMPIEFYLATNQTFSLTLSGGTAQYNILVVPEAG